MLISVSVAVSDPLVLIPPLMLSETFESITVTSRLPCRPPPPIPVLFPNTLVRRTTRTPSVTAPPPAPSALLLVSTESSMVRSPSENRPPPLPSVSPPVTVRFRTVIPAVEFWTTALLVQVCVMVKP